MRFRRPLTLSYAPILLSTLLSGCGTTTSTGGVPQNPPPTGNPGGGGTTNPAPTVAAFVYVVNSADYTPSSPRQIVAWSADANGQLTPISGSPFSENVNSVSVSGNYLMAAATSAPDINTYTIGANGALTRVQQFDYAQQTQYQANACGGVGDLYFDRTGQSLYAGVGNYGCNTNNGIASFSVDPLDGSLKYLGIQNIGYNTTPRVNFDGSNKYAYSAYNDGCYIFNLTAMIRDSNGLVGYNSTYTAPPLITPPPGAQETMVQAFYPGPSASDSTNHFVFAEFPCYKNSGTPAQLATYTIDASGNLSTTDTYATMPTTKVSAPEDLKMSPSGTLLAVGGKGGLEIFRFNGTTLTADGDLLTTDPIAQMFWDSHNHLYAITDNDTGTGGISPGKLYVFTVQDSQISAPEQAPSSPYTVATPWYLAVQSRE
jgi:6-phosphogluconolactonase (cycloisomerase 2 family)